MWFANKFIDLSSPQVMGVLNVTPDSFSDGGQHNQIDSALRRVETMIDEGAALIDVGGESTRPGAAEVSVSEELDRTISVVDAIAQRFDTVISIDTSKPKVMSEAVKVGAGLINDVRALTLNDAMAVASALVIEYGCVVSLMHMQGSPESMQDKPAYLSVTDQVEEFLAAQVARCIQAGIPKNKLLIDPGFGFGKSLDHNYQLLAELERFASFEQPLFVGISRKSMIGNLLQRDTHQRLAGSLAAAQIALSKGAKILRVHDVKETTDMIKIHNKVSEFENTL